MEEKPNRVSDHWVEIRQHIHSQWGKLSQSDIDGLKGNLDNLVTVLRKVYGIAESRAEREYHDFRVSLPCLLQPDVSAPESYRSRRQ